MKIFLDTSSLLKLYHYEQGTEMLDKLFEDFAVSKVFLSEIAKVEFDSAIWKKVRTGELMQDEALSLIDSFELDYDKYNFIELDSEIVNNARNLISKHGTTGLRTLDSIQLSSALKVKSELSLFVTADDLLRHLAETENLYVK
jgi:predicted nucleic acid-binding protein